MEEQEDKDCYHYDYKSDNTHERMKYINNPGNNSCGSYYISNNCKISRNQNQS
jgi:hypothetical protein